MITISMAKGTGPNSDILIFIYFYIDVIKEIIESSSK